MCAATNPFKVSDLIKKYGWTIMPYLGNLGVRNLAEAQVLFVDSGNTTDGADADDTEHGHSFEKPLLTWDYAVGLCTADEGAIILLAPGHNENIATQINVDVNGITTIGLGTGTLRPRFDFDAAASSINIGANNITIANITCMPGFADVLIGIDIETGKTNARIVDCEFLEGEAAGDEFLAAIELKASCHDVVIENNVFRAGWSSNPDDGISLKGASNRVTIRGNRFSGPYGDGAGVTAAISNSTGVCLDLLIENNIMKVKDGESGIEVIATTPAIIRHNLIVSTGCAIDSMIVATIGELDQNIGVTTDGTSGEFIKGGAISPEVVQYNLDHLAKTDTGVAADGDLTTLCADGTLLAHLMSATANTSTFKATTDSLEAISVAVAGIASPTDVTGAVPDTPTAKSLQDILSKADGANTFDNTTDSLEAISEALLAGTGCTAAIDADSLDKLVGTSDTDQAYPASLVSHSILSSIMASDGNPAGYDRATDSLEAIADAVAALSWATAVSQNPTARSMQDILEKDNSGSFDDATDSLEAIRDHLDGTTVLGGIQLDHLAQTVSAGTNYPTEITTDSILGMIMSANGNPNGFNKTTDSLEAISVALAAGTGCTAAIDADQLDTLVGTDTSVAADGDLTAHCLDGSIMAHIMSATKDTSTYKCTTDSLEAISVALAAGTGCDTALTNNQLDTLLGTTTSVAAGSDLEAHCVSGSLMAHILGVGADVTTFDCRTDSLEALALALGGFTLDGGTHYNDSVYANLVLLSKYIVDGDGDFATGQALPSNTSLVDIIGDFTGAHDGTDYDDNIFACLKKISTYICDGTGDFGSGAAMPANKSIYDIFGAYTADGGLDDEDTIMAHLDLIHNGTKKLHTRTLTDWSLSASNALWTVSGMVRARIWGEVLVGVKAVAMNLKLSGVPTAPGGAIDICANLDCNNDAAGTIYKMATTLGGAMQEVTGGVCYDDGIEVILPAGTVVMGSGANEDGGGSIQWFIRYEPLEAGAVVTNT